MTTINEKTLFTMESPVVQFVLTTLFTSIYFYGMHLDHGIIDDFIGEIRPLSKPLHSYYRTWKYSAIWVYLLLPSIFITYRPHALVGTHLMILILYLYEYAAIHRQYLAKMKEWCRNTDAWRGLRDFDRPYGEMVGMYDVFGREVYQHPYQWSHLICIRFFLYAQVMTQGFIPACCSMIAQRWDMILIAKYDTGYYGLCRLFCRDHFEYCEQLMLLRIAMQDAIFAREQEKHDRKLHYIGMRRAHREMLQRRLFADHEFLVKCASLVRIRRLPQTLQHEIREVQWKNGRLYTLQAMLDRYLRFAELEKRPRHLEPQSGEWTKEDDRKLYERRIAAAIQQNVKDAQAAAKKDKRRKGMKHKKGEKKYGEQAGEEFVQEILKQIAPWKELYRKIAPEQRIILNELENVVLTMLTMADCKSIQGLASCFVSYLKTHLNGPALMAATDYLADLIDPLQEQSLDDVMAEMRGALHDWKKVRHLPMFKHLCDLLSLAVSVGFCKATDVEIDFRGVKLFSIGMRKKAATAWDFLDAAMLAAEYFVEVGYEAYKTGSLKPFMYADIDAQHLDDDYMACREAMQMFSHGNLQHCKIKTDADLFDKLEDVYVRLDNLVRITEDKTVARVIAQKRNEVCDWRMEFLAKTNGGGLRKAPYTFIVWGASGVGKSSVMNNIISHLMVHRGEDPSDHRKIVSVNASDKYMSNVKSDTKVLIFDDMGAEGPDTADGNVARMWIDCSNNVRNYAVKADVADKGRCGLNHVIQGGTANSITGFMDLFCLYHAAAARRGERFRCELKPAFATCGRYDASKVRAVFGNDVLPDAYDFTVEHAVEDVNNPGAYFWAVSEWNGRRMKKVSYRDLMKYIIAMYDVHMADQTKMLDDMHAANANMKRCEICKQVNTLCDCCDRVAELDKQTGFLSHTCVRIFSSIFLGSMGTYEEWLSKFTAGQVMSLLTSFHASWTSWWYTAIPDTVWQTEYMQGVIRNLVEYRVHLSLKWLSSVVNMVYVFCLVAAGTAFAPITNCIALAALAHLTALSLAATSRQYIMTKIAASRYAVQGVVNATRTPFVVVGALGVIFTITYAIIVLSRSARRMVFQGVLSPQTPEDIAKRDELEKKRKKIEITPLPAVGTRTTVHEDLVELVFRNTLCVARKELSSKAVSDAFFPESNLVIIPKHMVLDEVREFTFAREPGNPSSEFRVKLCLKDTEQIGNSDMVLCQVPMAPPFKNLTTYFPAIGFTEGNCTLVYRTREGKKMEGPVLAKVDTVRVCGVSYTGYSYLAPFDTFKGLCMAALVGNKAVPMILGFHTAGNNGTPEGFSSPIDCRLYLAAREKLFAKHPSMLQAASAGTMVTQYFGKETVEAGKEIHLKSPLLETDGPIVYYGSCEGRVKPVSKVEPTMIADDVKEMCDAPQEYSGPRMGREAWANTLMHLRSPGIGFELSLADRAFTDMKEQCSHIFKPPFEVVKILSNIEIVSGMDDIAFVNGMEGSTSPGYGGSGPKSQLYIQLPPDEDHACPRTFPDWVWEEVKRYEQEYLQGHRCYPIFKACLKDEPTPVEKEKTRVFEGAPLTAQCLVRKYFLPLARQISLFPLVTGCSVGINPTGPMWGEMYGYVIKYGFEAILAGDYKKFDSSMSAQLTAMSFNLMIEWAKMTGNYTDDDILIMRGIVTDIIYPTVAYNGDLIGLLGSTPSGHNLTVYINSLCNALMLRMGFYELTGKWDAKFADFCAMIEYGDDFWGSVHESIRDKFNFVTFQKFLAENDMTLTMPDKESEAIPFLSADKCDFLKRHTRYAEELGCHVGALSEKSIIKSLKSAKKSKVLGKEEHSAVAIDGAIREWFFHGRDVFEVRHKQMVAIAEKHGLVHLIPELYTSFDDRVEAWKKQYA